MPQTLGLLLFQLGAPLGLVNAVTGVGTFGLLGSAVVQIGLAVGLSYLASLFQPSQPRPGDVQNNVRQSAGPRFRHYGRQKVGGTWVYATVSGEWFYKILALGTSKIDAIERQFYDNRELTVDAGSGGVTSPFWWSGHLTVVTRDGGDSPAHYSWIPGWPASALGKGVVSVAIGMRQVEAKRMQNVWPSVVFTQYHAVIRGVLVPDPSLGAAGVTNPANYSWSDNIARQICDYLIHQDGMRLSPTWITNALQDWQAAVFHANTPMEKPGGGTEPRYAGGTSYHLQERPADVLARMLQACDGRFVPTPNHGLALKVGRWEEPTVTIDGDAVTSFSDVGRGRDLMTVANTIRAQFTDPNNDYQATDADPWVDEDDVAARGELTQDLQLFSVQSHSQARRLMKLAWKRANPEWEGTITTNLRALPAIDQRFVRLTIPDLEIENITVEILGVSFIFSEGSVLTGLSIRFASLDASAYAWDASEGGTTPGTGSLDPGGAVIPPTGLMMSLEDRAGSIYAALSWTPASSAWATEVRYKLVAGTVWTDAIFVEAGTSTYDVGPLTEGEVYEFQVRSISVSETPSDWSGSITGGLGPELVSNGGFATDTIWAKGSGWSIGSGVATKVPGVGSNISQSISLTAGLPYRVRFEVTAIAAGTFRPNFLDGSTVAGTLRSAPGTYYETLTAATGNLRIGNAGANTTDGSVDNVSVRRRLS